MAGTQEMAENFAQEDLTEKEEGTFHGSWLFEQMLLSLIRDGETEKMRDFIEETSKTKPYTAGKLAEDPLRQAKNIFIGLVTMVGKTAAIPGGLDVEETYRLIDLYIRECEKSVAVETVTDLQYNMLFDFAERVAGSKLPEGLTWKVAQAMAHIQANTHAMLTIDEVAAHIGRSRAWLTRQFKKETGLTVNQYQLNCKLRDAKRLLAYTDMTLSEIASYLAFSSQAYFQTVFRRETGMTPGEYRRVPE